MLMNLKGFQTAHSFILNLIPNYFELIIFFTLSKCDVSNTDLFLVAFKNRNVLCFGIDYALGQTVQYTVSLKK